MTGESSQCTSQWANAGGQVVLTCTLINLWRILAQGIGLKIGQRRVVAGIKLKPFYSPMDMKWSRLWKLSPTSTHCPDKTSWELVLVLVIYFSNTATSSLFLLHDNPSSSDDINDMQWWCPSLYIQKYSQLHVVPGYPYHLQFPALLKMYQGDRWCVHMFTWDDWALQSEFSVSSLSRFFCSREVSLYSRSWYVI